VQALTEAVVMDDEELNQHGLSCLVDGLENHGARPSFGMARNEA
jgi:hypothetical protein